VGEGEEEEEGKKPRHCIYQLDGIDPTESKGYYGHIVYRGPESGAVIVIQRLCKIDHLCQPVFDYTATRYLASQAASYS
jgi:hypothetical protein